MLGYLCTLQYTWPGRAPGYQFPADLESPGKRISVQNYLGQGSLRQKTQDAGAPFHGLGASFSEFGPKLRE